MIKACSSIHKDSNHFQNQYELIKEKYVKDKYLIATACFQLATQICDRSIDTSRLIEYFNELARMDSNLSAIRLTREQLNETEIEILTTIDHTFPQFTPHMFICYFLRFLNDEMKIVNDRLYDGSMLLLVHIYLKWTSLIELLAKNESGLSTVNKIQMESVTQRLRDPLLLGSATILAASKMFCHGTNNSHIHDKIINLFVNLLGIDPMRIYMAQFFAEEVLQKSVNVRLLSGQIDGGLSSRNLIDREHDFDDESMMMTYSSP
ncbi:unnamed protein product [Adineta steineri]|uniref:Uncharacterized protein n=2 Tax=Adineta steineri TaxID=433720 RepID=A0A813NWK9_9BILA|nr:unnamed protein product [Adineta steineri]